jgi:hypothetical protein
MLETFPAINGPSLRWLERHRRLLAALRADSLRFNALNAGRCAGTAISSLRAHRFAGLAPLRLVLESLVGEEHLLAGCEHKFRAAFGALQYFIVEFHGTLRAVAERRSHSRHPQSDDAENEGNFLLFRIEEQKKARAKHPRISA